MSFERALHRSLARAIPKSRQTQCANTISFTSNARLLQPLNRDTPATSCSKISRTPTLRPYQSQRPFSTSQCLLKKKGGKAAREEKQDSKDTSSSNEDPHDLENLQSQIEKAISFLQDSLSKLRAGGRFNPQVVEDLRVQPEKGSSEMVRLSDLAQVVPKGRTVQILVAEQDYLKPITSAIQASSLSLTPQADPTGTNPLLIVLNIPPPTAESRRAAVNDASKATEKASTAIKDARAKQQKKLRTMEKEKSVRPDDLKKASDRMEKVVEKGQTEVKRIGDAAKKALESG